MWKNSEIEAYGLYYCMNCGNPVREGEKFCARCGIPPGKGTSYCPNCGALSTPDLICDTCGCASLSSRNKPIPPGYAQKSRVAAGLLGIFLGTFGAGRFYLGYKKMGWLQLAASIFTGGIGGFWGIIDGIMILKGSVEYDGNGYPLV
jgi:TM2 domain-containing membrane protein YozV